MPPKRGRVRAPQVHVAAIQSDYDTDAANMTDSAAPIPPRTNEELNLAVLKRHDPSVIDVIQVANFAVVYLFSPTSQQWEKCGIEGTLFVCELIPDQVPGAQTLVDRYNVIIINRKGLDNFSTDIFSTENVEITDEYVIIQVEGEDGTPQIYGLWIFSEPPPSSTAQTRKITAEKIYECAVRAEGSRQAAEEEAARSSGANGNGHTHAHPPVQEDIPVESQFEKEEVIEPEQPPVVGRQIAMNELFGQQPQPSQQQIQQLPLDQQEQMYQFMQAQHHSQQLAQYQQAQQQQMMQARQLQQSQQTQQAQHQDQMIAMLRGQALQKQPDPAEEARRIEAAQHHMRLLEQQHQQHHIVQQQQQQQQQQQYQPRNYPPQFTPQQQQQQQPDMARFFQQNPQLHPSHHASSYHNGAQNAAFANEFNQMASQQLHQAEQQNQQQQQRDVLQDLFRNAKQNYSG